MAVGHATADGDGTAEAPKTCHAAEPPSAELRDQFIVDLRRRFDRVTDRVTPARLDRAPDLAAARGVIVSRLIRDALRDAVLEPVSGQRLVQLRNARRHRGLKARVRRWGHWTKPYLDGAAITGWEAAAGPLREVGMDPQRTALQPGPFPRVIERGVDPITLRDAYVRTYRNLQSIQTDAAADALRRAIEEGMRSGASTDVVARQLVDEIDGLRRTRAEVLARTELARVESESALDRYDEMGVETVRHGEWSTAGDRRVCPICASLEGNTYPLEEFRNGTFTYTADGDEAPSLTGTYQLRPPAHPSCRCTILPVI